MSGYNNGVLLGALLFICFNLSIDAVVVERNPEMFYSAEVTSKKCPFLRVSRGYTDLRANGSLVGFTCNYGFDLYGQKYGFCEDCVCNIPTPVCTRLGCTPFPRLANGNLYHTDKGAVVLQFCEPGYKLNASKVSYCDGTRWNATSPKCIRTDIQPLTSCDFEVDDICDWTIDEENIDQWYHVNRKTPRGIDGSGPAYDHTFGAERIGHYMYIEGSTRSNSSARLISPLYRANLTVNGCLQFYYHMYGRHTGILRVLMKPENLDVSSIENDKDLMNQYVLFQTSGNLGDMWHHHNSSLNGKTKRSFQIIFEAFGGSGYLSNIAIDDISIVQGEKCGKSTAEMEIDKIHESDPFYPSGRDTCDNRCFENRTASARSDCQCYLGCLRDNNCCVDYIDMCILSDAFLKALHIPVPDDSAINENNEANATSSLNNCDSCGNKSTSDIALVIAATIPLLILFTVLTEIFVRGENSIFLKIRTFSRSDYKILKRNSSDVRFVMREASINNEANGE